MSGILYCGDNLGILSELRLVPEEAVDLVYLDPPFNSQRTYNIVYKDSRAQAEAFKDHWSWEEAAPTYEKLLEAPETPPKLRTLLRGLRDLLVDDDADLLAYLAMMAPRIFALHRVLKPTGSLYLHCDATASHYLKLVLDSVFGPNRFINEIVWKRTLPKGLMTRRLSNDHDVILAYGKGDAWTWNTEEMFEPYDLENLDEKTASQYNKVGSDGRRYQLTSLLNPNEDRPNLTYEFLGVTRVWRWTKERMRQAHADGLVVQSKPGGIPRYKRYLDEQRGKPMGDVWTDIAPLLGTDAERLGYPTQKPVSLLTRILRLASREGDLVLDPFCGCGTTIEACERVGRRWIGIDIARKAVEITEERFRKLKLQAPAVEWYPPDADAAAALAARPGGGNKFEEWARRKVRAVRRRKHDRGIDGEAFFKDERGHITHVLVSVKSGKLNPAMVRELRGTMAREQGTIGVLVSLHEPSKEMRLEATHAGYLSVSDDEGRIPRLQFVTVERLFSDKRPIRAPGVNVTEMPVATVPQAKAEAKQLSLDLSPKPRARPVQKVKRAREQQAAKRASERPETPKSSRRAGR